MAAGDVRSGTTKRCGFAVGGVGLVLFFLSVASSAAKKRRSSLGENDDDSSVTSATKKRRSSLGAVMTNILPQEEPKNLITTRHPEYEKETADASSAAPQKFTKTMGTPFVFPEKVQNVVRSMKGSRM